MNYPMKHRSWFRMQEANEQERQRIACLTGPLPQDDPALHRPTKIRVIKPFFISGKRVEIGEVASVPRFEADGLISLRRVEFV
jgi:hypothetical protein